MVGAIAGRRRPAAVRPLRRDRRRRDSGPVRRAHGPADLRERRRRGRRPGTAVGDQAPRADGRPAVRGTAGRERRDRTTAATGTTDGAHRFPNQGVARPRATPTRIEGAAKSFFKSRTYLTRFLSKTINTTTQHVRLRYNWLKKTEVG